MQDDSQDVEAGEPGEQADAKTCSVCATPWRKAPAIDGVEFCADCATAAPLSDTKESVKRAIAEAEAGGRPSARTIREAHIYWGGSEWMMFGNQMGRMESRGRCYISTCGWNATPDDDCSPNDVSWFKIGKANNVKTRMATARTDNPMEVEVALHIPGGFYTEQLLHGMADRDGIPRSKSGHTEWFVGDADDWIEWHQIDDARMGELDWADAYLGEVG